MGGVASFLMIVTFAIMVWLLSELNFRYKSKAVLTLSLLLSIIPLVLIKYTLFAIGTINSVLGSDIGTPSLIVPIGDYEGTNLYTITEMEEIAQSALMAQNEIESKGIKLAILVAPNKENVYSEYMPDVYSHVVKLVQI